MSRPFTWDIEQSGAAVGDAPLWDGDQWTPGAVSSGGTVGPVDLDGAKVAEQAPDDAAIWFPANMGDITVSASPGDRQVVLAPSATWEDGAVQEASVWFEAGQFHMIYTGGWTLPCALGYATADHPLGPWTKHASNPVLGGGAGGESGTAKSSFHFVDDDGQHYTYYAHTYTGSGNFDVMVATGAPPSLTKVGTALTHTVSAPAIQNVCVVNDGGTYRMIFESRDSSGTLWKLGYATASSPLGPFTVNTYPLTSLQIGTGSWSGPFLRRDSAGTGWVLLYHASTTSTLPSRIYRATSTDLVSWTQDPAGVLVDLVTDPPEHDQVADPAYLVTDFGAFLFFEGVDNTADTSSIEASQVVTGDPQWFDGATWHTDWPAATYTDEQARDAIGAALVAGSNVTITVNDGADTITIAATSSGSSGELVMTDGVTSPPVPVTNEAGDDWLYYG